MEVYLGSPVVLLTLTLGTSGGDNTVTAFRSWGCRMTGSAGWGKGPQQVPPVTLGVQGCTADTPQPKAFQVGSSNNGSRKVHHAMTTKSHGDLSLNRHIL